MANSVFPSFPFQLITKSLLITFFLVLLPPAGREVSRFNNSSFSFNFAQNTHEKTNTFSLSVMVFSSISGIIPQNIWEAIQKGERERREGGGRRGESREGFKMWVGRLSPFLLPSLRLFFPSARLPFRV